MEKEISESDNATKAITENADRLSHEADVEELQDLCMDVLSAFFRSVGNTVKN